MLLTIVLLADLTTGIVVMSEEQPRLMSRTSERYLEETQLSHDSEDGMTYDDLAEETEDEHSFVRRFEEAVIANDVDMDKVFTRDEWKELPELLKIQIRAYRFAKEHQRRRALDAAPPSRTERLLDVPGATTETLLDRNVTRRIRASDTAETNIEKPVFAKNQALSCQKSRKTSTNTHVVL